MARKATEQRLDTPTQGKEPKKKRFLSHEPFACSLQLALMPLGVDVRAEVPVISKAPTLDVVLIRKQTKYWTEAQRERLCDGIRDSEAAHILIEFKYTETVSLKVLQKAIGCIGYYPDDPELKPMELAMFIISSSTPSSKEIKKLGYKPTQPGVLKSKQWGYRDLTIISLNGLLGILVPRTLGFWCVKNDILERSPVLVIPQI